MLDEWEETTLGDVIDVKHGMAFQGEFFHDEPRGDILLTPGNFAIGGGFKGAKLKYYEGPVPAEFILAEGDLLITMTDLSRNADTLGYSAFVPARLDGRRYLHNQRLGKVTAKDPERIDIDYLHYLMRSHEYRQEVLGSATGTTVKHTSPERIKRFRFLRPRLAEQRAIAHILATLDDKIELNRRMNQTLEAMAQALFKSWFVDFDPFHDQGMQDSSLGEIPVGWGVKPLDQVARFVNGLALQKYPPDGEDYLPVIKIGELRRGVTGSSGKASRFIDSDYVVEDGDVLFSWSGSLEVCIWCGGKGALNQHLFKVTSPYYPKWFYYFWIKHHLPGFRAIASGKATTMGHIQRYHLTNALVAIPPEEESDRLDRVVDPVVELIVANSLQSRTLTRVRDYLLPKLLSGEIRVRDVEKLLEEKT